MQRFVLALLVLGTVALVAAVAVVWKKDRGSVSIPVSSQPAVGSGRTIGQSALSHGGTLPQQARDSEKAGPALPYVKEQDNDSRTEKPDGGRP